MEYEFKVPRDGIVLCESFEGILTLLREPLFEVYRRFEFQGCFEERFELRCRKSVEPWSERLWREFEHFANDLLNYSQGGLGVALSAALSKS